MVHCSRTCKPVTGAAWLAITYQDTAAAKFAYGAKPVFVGDIVPDEDRHGTGERSQRHEG